jgi:hypothetical protein
MHGINKLTEAVVQQRRQQSLLGGDQGANQAAIRAGGVVDPNSRTALTNIALGKAGVIPQLRGLQGVLQGDYDPKDKVERMYEKFMEHLVKIGETSANPMQEALARGAGNIIGEDVIARVTGEGGRGEWNKMQDLMKNKPAEMTKTAQDAWTDLGQAWKNFSDNFINRMAEALVPLAKGLTWVAEKMTFLTNLSTNKDANKWADEFLERNKAWLEEHINKPLEALDKPLETLKGWFVELGTKVGDLVSQIGALLHSWFWRAVTSITGGGQGESGTTQAPSAPLGPSTMMPVPSPPLGPNIMMPVPPMPGPSAPMFPSKPMPGIPLVPSAPGSPGVGFPGMPGGPAIPGMPGIPGTTAPATAPTAPWGTGGSKFFNQSLPWDRVITNAPGDRGDAFNPQNNMNIRGGMSSVDASSRFASAAQKSNPGGGNSMMAMLSQNQTNVRGGSRRGGGALDSNNWQSSRTASLRIDNIAGANIHTSANAMSS